MTSIVVTKDEFGKLCGFGEKDKLAYAKFKAKLDALEPGELFQLEHWFPRDGRLHRKHFAMLAVIFDAQERFEDREQLRMWLQVGAGWCDFLPGPDGELVAVPKSISYAVLDQPDFEEHHQKVKDFLRSEHARAFLWPHLTPEQAWITVETILEQFERERG